MTSPSMARSSGVTIALIGLPEPHASRLAEAIQLRTSVNAQVIEALHHVSQDAWILAAPEWADQVVDYVLGLPAGHPERIAILWGARAETDMLQEFSDQGLVVLTGPLPGPVIAWAEEAVRNAPGPEDPFAWNEDPKPNATAGLAWDEALEPPPAGRSPRSPANSLAMPAEAEPAAWATPASTRSQEGRIVAVYSSGGGVGKTTTAVYLGTIAVQRRVAVTVLEMDEDRRGILTYWNQKPRNGGLDAIPAADWDDPGRLADRLASMAVSVHPRLTVLPMAGTVTGLQYPLTHADSAATHLLSWARQHSAWTWVDLPARLRDGTPVMLGQRRGRGTLVYVLTTANTAWSDWVLAAEFPDLIRRLLRLGVGVRPRHGVVSLRRALDGQGALVKAGTAARPARIASLAQAMVSPVTPPGIWGNRQGRLAVNIGDHVPMLRAGHLPPDVRVLPLTGLPSARRFGPGLIALGLALLLLDWLVTLGLRGLLRGAGWLAVLMVGWAAMPRAHAALALVPKATLRTGAAPWRCLRWQGRWWRSWSSPWPAPSRIG